MTDLLEINSLPLQFYVLHSHGGSGWGWWNPCIMGFAVSFTQHETVKLLVGMNFETKANRDKSLSQSFIISLTPSTCKQQNHGNLKHLIWQTWAVGHVSCQTNTFVNWRGVSDFPLPSYPPARKTYSSQWKHSERGHELLK